MVKMSNKMIDRMLQQYSDCLQRFIKADELSASDLEFMANHAWEIEWYANRLLNRKRKEDKN